MRDCRREKHRNHNQVKLSFRRMKYLFFMYFNIGGVYEAVIKSIIVIVLAQPELYRKPMFDC